MSNIFIVGASGGPPPVVVQTVKHNVSSSSLSSQNVTYNSAVTAGNTLIAVIGWAAGSGSISSISDNVNSGNWSLSGLLEQGNGFSAVVYVWASTLAGTPIVTVTLSSSSTYLDIAILEVSGLNGWVDTYAIGTGASSVPSFGPLVTLGLNDFIVALVAGTVATGVSGGSSGWTFTQLTTSKYGLQYIIGNTPGSYNPSFTPSLAGWAATAVALVAGPPPSVYSYFRQANLQTFNSGSSAAALSMGTVVAQNCLVACVGWASGTVTAPTNVKDNLNNINFTLAGSVQYANGMGAAIYYYPYTIGGSATVTATMPGTCTQLQLDLFEAVNVIGVDAFTSATGASGTTAAPGALTTTIGYEVLLAFNASAAASNSGNPDWNFLKLTSSLYGVEWKNGAVKGMYNPSFSQTSGAYSTVAVAFKVGLPPGRVTAPIETQKPTDAFSVSSLDYQLTVVSGGTLTEAQKPTDTFSVSSLDYQLTVIFGGPITETQAPTDTFAITSFNYA